ncbi:serine/threonine phosphatase stp [Desulfosporosinus acididurans]|uniref:Serine/threonine phosphatase stp n=1 Tax=Desulfosporosinus acididurans TaxID=476652 RepID=A0A0J1FLA5_9FIRM|nr:protein phosphatase 2C domain-containing protein [Desulfosporosinus acididurans]KLU64147.1 serine/threonine phosphatase stp [Desulfosporosinus acididurans]
MRVNHVPKIYLTPGNAQHIGSREEQQDAFYFSDFFDAQSIQDNGILAVLADGMGGHDMGKTAASIAIETFVDSYQLSNIQDSVPGRLAKAIDAANQAVAKLGLEVNVDTGCTLIASVVKEGLLYWVGTGDSRIYLWCQGRLVRITSDFTFARNLEKLVAEQYISEEEAMKNDQRHYLYSYIGVRDNFRFDVCQKPIFLKQGYKLLLCSDGLFGTLSEAEIAEEMSALPQQAADKLLDKTLRKNIQHQDNVTILIIGC